MKICESELDYKVLKCVHRLDRQTSGIVFFAKKDEASNDFREAMIDNKVGKVYYARVKGDFRKACKLNDKEEEKKDDVEEFKVTCDKSVYCISNVEAKWDCSDKDKVPFEYKHQAKEAFTTFIF